MKSIALVAAIAILVGCVAQAAPRPKPTTNFYYCVATPAIPSDVLNREICHAGPYEPMMPGGTYVMYGCGFAPGNLSVSDEVTIQSYPFFHVDPAHEGEQLAASDVVTVASDGCVFAYYRAWGNGLHTYKFRQGKPKPLVIDTKDVTQHHEGFGSTVDYALPPEGIFYQW